jgi:hypothetical protein
VSIITGIGYALVSWGLGGGSGSVDEPATIHVREFGKVKIGGVAVSPRVEFRSALSGALIDPTGIVVRVRSPAGDDFEIEYLVSPTNGSGDAIIRDAEGKYSLQIDATEARGVGKYRYVITSTGAKAVDDGEFEVYDTVI